MKHSNNNIEDIFQSGLTDFRVNPSGKIWEAVETNLDDKSMESLFHDKLVESKISPSSKVWKRIASNLPKKSFWQLGQKTVNIYAIAVMLALLISLSFIVYPYINTNKEGMLEERTSRITNEKVESNVLTEAKDGDLISNKGNVISSGGDVTSENTKPEYENQTNPVALNDEDEKKKTEQTTDNKHNIKDKEAKPLQSIDNKDITVESSHLKTFVDTLVVYDTIQYYDTLIVETQKSIENKVHKYNWSIVPKVSIFSANPIHKGNNSSSSELADLYDKATDDNLSYTYGIGASYDYKAWRFSSGIDYTFIQEEFNYETNRIETESVTKYTLTEDDYDLSVIENITYIFDPQYSLQVDTIASYYTVHKIEYEDYSVIDTIWRYKVDSNIVQVSDSLEVVSYDTVRVLTYDTAYYNTIDTNIYTTYYQNINKYTYIDIPLTIGYGIKIRKLTLRPTLGAIFGIMLNAKGKGISMDDKNVVYNLSESELPFMNLQISMYLGLGIEYRIQDNMRIYVQPFYRRNLSSIYQSSVSLNKYFSGTGASFGLSFYFN